MSAGKFPPPQAVTSENYTLAQIHRANDMLAAALHTDNRIVADSGHNMMLYDPAAVVEVIEGIVARLR